MGQHDIDLAPTNRLSQPAQLRAVEEFGPGEDLSVDLSHGPIVLFGKGPARRFLGLQARAVFLTRRAHTAVDGCAHRSMSGSNHGTLPLVQPVLTSPAAQRRLGGA